MTRSTGRDRLSGANWGRKRLHLRAKDMDAAIKASKATCPLSDQEIGTWAMQLNLPKDAERRLKRTVTYWFKQAQSLVSVESHSVQARRRDYVNRRLFLGDVPDKIEFPKHFDRVDLWLPEIAARLLAVRSELSTLTGEIEAALRIRPGHDAYETALGLMGALADRLNELGSNWHRPGSGQPSLETDSYAIDLLVCAIEDVTGEAFPSPRSYKRAAEIDLVQLLAGKLFPARTPENIRTMLRHFHKRRLTEKPAPARGAL